MGVWKGFIDALFPSSSKKTDDRHPTACRGKWLRKFDEGTLGNLLYTLKKNGQYINRITVYNGSREHGWGFAYSPIREYSKVFPREYRYPWISKFREKEIDDSVLERKVLEYVIIRNRNEEWAELDESCKRYWPSPDKYYGSRECYPILKVYVEERDEKPYWGTKVSE